MRSSSGLIVYLHGVGPLYWKTQLQLHRVLQFWPLLKSYDRLPTTLCNFRLLTIVQRDTIGQSVGSILVKDTPKPL